MMDWIKGRYTGTLPAYKQADTLDNERLIPNENSMVAKNRDRRLSVRQWLALGVLLITIIVVEWLVIMKFMTRGLAYDTEFAAAKPAISLHKVRFSGSIKFDDNGRGYRTTEGARKYTGKPSPEIDKAWEDLMDHRYFWFSEDEARQSFGPDYKKYELDYVDEHGEYRLGYIGGVDIFHTLHCLNTLRMMAQPTYYPPMVLNFEADPGTHLDHCIDQLRQVIMCNADLTPVPIEWRPTANISYTNTDVTHTCRNFDALQSWVRARDFHDLEDPWVPEKR